MSRHFHLVGITHIDLAWKRGFAEMAELLEMSVVWLLDTLERYPDFKYTLEQVAHYRALATRRPDLIARLAPHLRSGRLEFAGGLASTLDLNLPHAECLVRNQSLGLRWLRDTWGITPATAYTVDTFGHPAQLPQVFRQFGFTHLLTSRGGGELPDDLFHARGLDGSTLLVACWHTYGAYVKPQNLAETIYFDWAALDPLFTKAASLRGSGPYLIVPYTENEAPISRRAFDLAAARAHSRPDETWHVSTPADFFRALDAAPRALPTISADLNPEFTGCFSNRIALRLRNRAVETLLLDAECAGASAAVLDSAWWDLAHVQFHDVLTGSHPTPVYHEAIALLNHAESTAHAALGSAPSAPRHVFNALPWPRREWLSLPNGYSYPLDLPACASVPFVPPNLPPAPRFTPRSSAILENEFIRFEADTIRGLRRLVWLPTNTVLLADAGDFLVAQHDRGNFQIEQPESGEVAASSGTLQLTASDDVQSIVLSGEFPPLDWAGPAAYLRWEATFTLRPGRPALDLTLRLDWRGEATRLRLKLATTLDTGSAIHEIPFGAVTRRAYTPRANARGEWPVQRWAALEAAGHGLALANTGVAGVESLGGTLYTTLLRAPAADYVGMVPDATSSQHGPHAFTFALVPYAGPWRDSALVRLAQALNHPPRLLSTPAASAPGLTLEGDPSIVFSSAKPADDGTPTLVVRLYETAGVSARALLRLPALATATRSNLREQLAVQLPVSDSSVTLSLNPFEILTLRLTRTSAP